MFLGVSLICNPDCLEKKGTGAERWVYKWVGAGRQDPVKTGQGVYLVKTGSHRDVTFYDDVTFPRFMHSCQYSLIDLLLML